MDLKDKKLLYWLDQNSRTTNKELGRKIGLTEQAIGYRIKRLQENGTIKKFATFINTLNLGYEHYKVFLKLQKITDEIEERFIQTLVSNPNVRWVVTISGRYDLSFSVLAKSAQEFSKIYRKIESEYCDYVIEKNIILNLNSPGFTREYLVNKDISKKLIYSLSKEKPKYDEIDEKILKAISQNARKNIVEIAREISETVDIVKYRLKKLTEKKIISGFTIQLDLEKIGYEYYSILCNTHNITEQIENKLISFTISHPNIHFIVNTIGSHDLQLELEVRNYSELDNLLKEFRKAFSPYLRNFEILRIKQEYKYDFFPFHCS